MIFAFDKSPPLSLNKRWTYVLLLVWFSLVPTAILGTFAFKYYELSIRAIITPGKIIELRPQIHNSVVYEYIVAGKVFQGTADGFADKGFQAKVNVYYDSAKPWNSSLGDPKRLFVSMLVGLVIIFCFCLLLCCVILFTNNQKKATNAVEMPIPR